MYYSMGKGIVTNINSNSNVEVNGIPRHVADLRRVPEIQIHEPPAVNPDPAAELNIEPGIEPTIPQHRPQRQCNMLRDMAIIYMMYKVWNVYCMYVCTCMYVF